MNTADRDRRAGLALLAAALLWMVARLLEERFGLHPPGHGLVLDLDQALFVVAELGFVAGILRVLGSGAAGAGRVGRGALVLFALGWIIEVIAGPLVLLTGDANLALLPIGGLCAFVGSLVAGIAVAAAGRWAGWRRWSVLCYSLYYVLILFLPAIVAQRDPGFVAELLWGLAWVPLGYALVSRPALPRKAAIA
jgi:hypothetical protein